MDKKLLTLADICGAQVRRWLRYGGIKSLEELLDMTREEVSAIYNIGDHRLEIILNGLKHHGLKLKAPYECD